MKRVLLTHADTHLGRRMVKALSRDPDVELVFGVGRSLEPSWFGSYLDRARYQRVDLSRARQLIQLLHSDRWIRANIDSVVHLPYVGDVANAPAAGKVATLVSETRRLVAACRERARIDRFVYLSTGFVYAPEPANGAVVSEDHPLGFETATDPLVRAWIDADKACSAEIEREGLCMSVLRAGAVATTSGEFVNVEPLRGTALPGFDPLVSVVTERDVARAVLLALHADQSGIYNVAGREVLARSQVVANQNPLAPLPVPRSLLGVAALAKGWVRGRPVSPFHRYGIVLSTRHAEHELGFRPAEHIASRPSPAGPPLVDVVPYA